MFSVTRYTAWMHRLIPQWLARWFCGRRNHRYIHLAQQDARWGGEAPEHAPSASGQLPDGTVIAVYTCRCGDRQETKVYGGRFPLQKS